MSENPANDSKPQGGDVKENTHIKIVVKAVDESEVHFKLKKVTPFQKLINNYCEKMGLSLAAHRFTFEGVRVDPEKTPNDYQMEDDDIIDVFTEQVGGLRV